LNKVSVRCAHFTDEILDSEPTQDHLRFLLRVSLEAERLQLLIESLTKLDDIGLEDRLAHVSGASTSRQQLVDDGRCELLWVPTSVGEQFGKLENVSSVFLDVLSRERLWLEFFDLLLDPLDVLEIVLLHNINQLEPVENKELVLFFIRYQSVNRLAQARLK
jgi:hypothetical protein